MDTGTPAGMAQEGGHCGRKTLTAAAPAGDPAGREPECARTRDGPQVNRDGSQDRQEVCASISRFSLP